MNWNRIKNSVDPRAVALGILAIFSIWFAASPLFTIAPDVDGGHATPGHFVREDPSDAGPYLDANHGGHAAAPVAAASGESGHIHGGAVHATCSALSVIHDNCQSQVEAPSASAISPAAGDALWQSRTQAPEPLPPRSV